MTAKPFPILFIAPMAAADAVATSGLLRRLAGEIPGARFTIVASRGAAPLFAEVPSLAKLIVVGSFSAFGLWTKVRGHRWGLVLDAQGTGVSSFLSRAKRAEWKAPSAPVAAASSGTCRRSASGC